MTQTAIPDGCRWCGARHGHVCPYVQAIEFHADGTVKRVEFHGPALTTLAIDMSHKDTMRSP